MRIGAMGCARMKNLENLETFSFLPAAPRGGNSPQLFSPQPIKNLTGARRTWPCKNFSDRIFLGSPRDLAHAMAMAFVINSLRNS